MGTVWRERAEGWEARALAAEQDRHRARTDAECLASALEMAEMALAADHDEFRARALKMATSALNVTGYRS